MNANNRPFLKWPGRKYVISSNIIKHFPIGDNIDTLVEPFLGSGAIYLNTNYKNYYLSDNNPDLINLYMYLINEGEKFIKYCSKLFIDENNNSQKYYELRDIFNNTKSLRKKSAVFLYLNRHGYNGLCRYNSKGGYNVPFGSYTKVKLPAQEMQLFFEKSMSVNLTLKCSDFTECLGNVTSNSIVYCDPPYVPISASSSFTMYNKHNFNYSNQQQLVDMIKQLKENGVSSCISNHDLDITRKLYKDSRIVSFKVKRLISCKSQQRKYVKELLAIYDHE